MKALYTETSSLRTLKIMPINLNEIVPSWILLQEACFNFSRNNKYNDNGIPSFTPPPPPHPPKFQNVFEEPVDNTTGKRRVGSFADRWLQ